MFDINIEGNFEDARIGLVVTSMQIEKESYLYTTRVSRFAEKTLHALVPVGETGNLQRAVKSSITATPIRETTGTGRFAGGGWESRAYIDNRGLIFYTGRRPKAPGVTKNPPQDPPIEYALAIDEGREAMTAGQFGRAKFAWYDNNRAPLINSKTGKNKSPYGYNIFKGALRARPGQHFLLRTHIATEQYAAEQVREFMRRKGRSTTSSRALDRFELGIFQGNPTNLPV